MPSLIFYERFIVGIVHLIVGSTGAGKSTYALKLADSLNAVRFSIDEWMDDLFSDDKPDDAGFDWYWPRIQRCEARLWTIACQALAMDTPVILDLGLSTRSHRDKFRTLAAEAGYPVRLHFLDVDAATRWTRVEVRNAQQGETFSLIVTREMFDFVESIFEAPSADEQTDDDAH